MASQVNGADTTSATPGTVNAATGLLRATASLTRPPAIVPTKPATQTMPPKMTVALARGRPRTRKK